MDVLRRTRRLALTLAILVGALAIPSTTSAYTPGSAATWADNHWNIACDGTLPCTVITNDCADFVSAAIHLGGGYPFRNPYLNVNDDHNWWYKMGVDYSATFTYSWVRVLNQLDFLLLDGGTWGPTMPGSSTASDSGGRTGDAIYYDWDGDQYADHVAIITGYGWSHTGSHYGDYVDAHTNARYHEFWTLIEFNSSWRTTLIATVHV